MSIGENSLGVVASAQAVLLLAMPLANPHHPAIGLSLIQGVLRSAGITAEIRHLYLDFVEMIGPEAYSMVADERCFTALLGEWLFADAVCADPASDLAYLNRVLRDEHGDLFASARLLQLLTVRSQVQAFLDQCDASIPWDRYSVIGFSSSFQQTMATLAMAKRIKTRFPTKQIILGGANAEGAMGLELLRLYPWIDVVVGGEAEHVVPGVVKALLRGAPVPAWPGVQARNMAHSKFPIPAPQALDQLPHLDYSDFVADRARCPKTGGHYRTVALFESARGCWWGAKHHCTFCGLNGPSMAFRSKSPARAAAELAELANRHGPEILVVDNILDHRYFTTLLPLLAEFNPPLVMHCEVKANLDEAQVLALARAGFHKLQPGIESLSTPILQLMRKGTTALRNIQTLKLAAEAGVFIDWGHLYGFPGEVAAQYDEIAALVPKLLHLQPPSGANLVRADRFSPYWREPEQFGIQITPMPAYSHLHRDPSARIADLAYHFRISYKRSPDLSRAWEEFSVALAGWAARSDATLTVAESAAGRAIVRDGRGARAREFELEPPAAAVLRACATLLGRSQLLALMGLGFGPSAVAAAIEFLSDEGLLLEEASLLLSLPLRQPGLARAPAAQAIGTLFRQSFACSGTTNLEVAK
jgi:ribosomal peptide maturation radical SAM protein 1